MFSVVYFEPQTFVCIQVFVLFSDEQEVGTI